MNEDFSVAVFELFTLGLISSSFDAWGLPGLCFEVHRNPIIPWSKADRIELACLLLWLASMGFVTGVVSHWEGLQVGLKANSPPFLDSGFVCYVGLLLIPLTVILTLCEARWRRGLWSLLPLLTVTTVIAAILNCGPVQHREFMRGRAEGLATRGRAVLQPQAVLAWAKKQTGNSHSQMELEASLQEFAKAKIAFVEAREPWIFLNQGEGDFLAIATGPEQEPPSTHSTEVTDGIWVLEQSGMR